MPAQIATLDADCHQKTKQLMASRWLEIRTDILQHDGQLYDSPLLWLLTHPLYALLLKFM